MLVLVCKHKTKSAQHAADSHTYIQKNLQSTTQPEDKIFSSNRDAGKVCAHKLVSHSAQKGHQQTQQLVQTRVSVITTARLEDKAAKIRVSLFI